MPRTPLTQYDLSKVPALDDPATFNVNAEFFVQFVVATLLPQFNANLEWLDGALSGADTLVGAVSALQADQDNLLRADGASPYSGTVRVNVGATDFYVSDGAAPFIKRDKGNGRLHLGGEDTDLVTLRSNLMLDAPNFKGINLGEGVINLKIHHYDGNGPSVCIQPSTNPSDGGLFVSFRAQNGDLALGASTTRVASAVPDMYLRTNGRGEHGARVLHSAILPDEVGSYVFANCRSGQDHDMGYEVPGDQLKPSNAGGGSGGDPLTGRWRLHGYKAGGSTSFSGTYETTLWKKIE